MYDYSCCVNYIESTYILLIYNIFYVFFLILSYQYKL